MPMLMQNAIAKMIQKPCEANAGLEICISVLNLVRCPRSHTTTLVAIRQNGLEIFNFF
jgi:hypothetical protein